MFSVYREMLVENPVSLLHKLCRAQNCIENIKRDCKILVWQSLFFHQRLCYLLKLSPGEQNREYAKLHAATGH
jgi:hypothetical protein